MFYGHDNIMHPCKAFDWLGSMEVKFFDNFFINLSIHYLFIHSFVHSYFHSRRNKEVGVVLGKVKEAGSMSDDGIKQLCEKSVKTILRVKAIKPDLHRQWVNFIISIQNSIQNLRLSPVLCSVFFAVFELESIFWFILYWYLFVSVKSAFPFFAERFIAS